jgi:hypothetical protein
MGKSKTQAQKRKEREERQQLKAAERLKQKEFFLRQLKQKQEQESIPEKEIMPNSEEEEDLQSPNKCASPAIPEEVRASDLEINEDLQPAAVESFTCTMRDSEINSSFSSKEEDTTKKLAELSLEQERNTSTIAKTRIVQNHSTYCEGLRPVLARLQRFLPKCTIIPGALSQGKSHYEELTLRLQRAIDTHTYALVARNGYTSQEDLQENPGEICTSLFNHEKQKARQTLLREQHHEKSIRDKQHEQQLEEEKKVDQQRRKLKTKAVDPNHIDDLAKRDVAIISGKSRSKHSMT